MKERKFKSRLLQFLFGALTVNSVVEFGCLCPFAVVDLRIQKIAYLLHFLIVKKKLSVNQESTRS